MRHLIVYTHLNPESFTKAVTDEVLRVLEANDHEVRIIDLYKDDFAPVLKFPDIQYGFYGGRSSKGCGKISRINYLG